MSTQGPNYPASGVSTSSGDANEVTWTNPGNITADDATEAQITAATFDSPDPSFYLVASDFGFTIPAGATVDGITVEIDRRSIIASSGIDVEVVLQDDTAAIVGANKATATVWPTSLTVATYGGAADTWTASPTVAMVNHANFGVRLQARANIANADIGVDFIRVTITYTPDPNALVTPSTVDISTSLPAPTPQAGAISAVSAVDISASVPDPTIIAGGGASDVTVTPDTIACTVDIPTPGSSQVVTPTTVPVSTRVGDSWSDVAVASTLVGAANVTVTPATIAVSASLPALTVLAGAKPLPDAIAATVSLPAPTVSGKAVTAPSTIAPSVSVPTPTVSVTGAATVSPATVDIQVSLSAPTVQGKSLTAPSAIGVSSSVGAVTIQAGAKPTPGVVAATTSLPAPTVSGKAIVQPSTITVQAAVPTPSVSVGGSTTASPSTVEISASVPTPTVVAVSSVMVTPSSIGIAASVPTPTVLVAGNVTVSPATIAVTTSVLAPTLRSDQRVTPASVVISASVQAATVHAVAVVQGLTITGVVGLPPPIVFAGAAGLPVDDPQAGWTEPPGKGVLVGAGVGATWTQAEGKAVLGGGSSGKAEWQ